MALQRDRRLPGSPGPFGEYLRRWRGLRGLSQLALAGQSGVSARHLSFLETGRSQASREMVLLLGAALELPLRERNLLLEAAGFAPHFCESELGAPQLAAVRKVLDWILAGCEPNGAAVLDRSRNVLVHNAGWRNQLSFLVDLRRISGTRPPNTLRILFHPAGLRTVLVNWPEVARAQLSRLYREMRGLGDDPVLRALYGELVSYPEVSEEWRYPEPDRPELVVLPLHVRAKGIEVRIFSTITRIGAPRDVTLQELQVEAFAPADDESEALLARIGRGEKATP